MISQKQLSNFVINDIATASSKGRIDEVCYLKETGLMYFYVVNSALAVSSPEIIDARGTDAYWVSITAGGATASISGVQVFTVDDPLDLPTITGINDGDIATVKTNPPTFYIYLAGMWHVFDNNSTKVIVDNFTTVLGQTSFILSEDPIPSEKVILYYCGGSYIEGESFTRVSRVINWNGPFFFEDSEVVKFKYLAYK